VIEYARVCMQLCGRADRKKLIMYVLKKRENAVSEVRYIFLSNFPFTFLKAMGYTHLVRYPA
jgi:hypothetical protein